ncbi:hypothetical protein N7523_001635 [Penicillium sp. IBT 18751x]|nr:hypothetical protein N7523_001635 [Penicillium sp. IBT 18751x]
MYNSHTDIWFAGAFAAVTVDFIVYPFDTLKTRIQSPNYDTVFKDARTGAIRRNVLFKGLYQGIWSVVFSTIPSSGAFFTTYEAVKCTLHDSSTHSKANPSSPEYYSQGSRIALPLPFTHSLPTPIIHGIASSTAEMVSCLLLTPAEVIKQNAQMINSEKGSVTPVRQVLWKFKGRPWRLWSGYTALVGRNLPMTGIQFPLFEYLRTRILTWRRERGIGKGDKVREQLVERAGVTGLSAGLAGTVASFVTTPIDVVKTRVMLSASADADGDGNGKGKGKAKGALTVGREIYRKDGVRGLFRGGAIRAGWTAVAVSLYLSIYESGRFFLEERRKGMEGIDGVADGDAVM